MDTTMIIIVIAAVALIGFWLYNRNKPAPRGTYDDKNVRSSGSIGGGTRAHDDPNVRSSGSIGGGTRAHDAREHGSGGSIGGQQRTENSSVARPRSTSQQRTDVRELRNTEAEADRPLRPLNNGAHDEEQDEKKRDDQFRSGGSFGGSHS